jgi:mRNA interferase RelE/StbE
VSGKYRVLLEPRTRKNLAHIGPVIRRRIGAAIDALCGDPRPAGCKPLKGGAGVLRTRTGDYRIVYSVDDGKLEVVIIDIDHRRDIYR